jgi:hypothetical protein
VIILAEYIHTYLYAKINTFYNMSINAAESRLTGDIYNTNGQLIRKQRGEVKSQKEKLNKNTIEPLYMQGPSRYES